MEKVKLYYFAPHPVQYHVGLYRELAQANPIELKVIYESKVGLEPIYVEEFKSVITWDIDLLKGYKYEFLKNLA